MIIIWQIDEYNFPVYIAHKNRVREEMERDTKLVNVKRYYLFTTDYQAVKLCPTLQASALYYSIKLKVYNITVYNNATVNCKNYW